MQDTYPIPFNGGIDRSVVPLANRRGFYYLRQLKYDEYSFGRLKSTVPFAESAAGSQKTYYSIAGGASQTEAAASSVRMIVNNTAVGTVYATDYAINSAMSTSIQTYYMTTMPAAETIYTGCLLRINSLSGLGINLGSTLDVEIDAVNTFRWRKNGGAWTAGVACSTAGTAIDGGNATIYFLANTGFTITDTWSWTRVDAAWDTTRNILSAIGQQNPFWNYNDTIFYIDSGWQVAAVRLAGSTMYALSVGYRPVYGTHVCVFDNHLVVANYKTTPYTAASQLNRVIGWSDLSDLDCFIATNVNEADTYTIPIDTGNTVTTMVVFGVNVVARQLIVSTTYNIYRAINVGIDNGVFQFSKLNDLPTQQSNAWLYTAQGVESIFILGKSAIWTYNGIEFKRISDPIISYFSNNLTVRGLVYDDSIDELTMLFVGGTLLSYQQKYDSYYIRSVDFGSTYGVARSLGYITGGTLLIGCANIKLVTESNTAATQKLKDLSSGAAFAYPEIVTQGIWDGRLSDAKELNGVYVGFGLSTSSTSYVYSGADVEVHVDKMVLDTGVTGAQPTPDANTFVTTTSEHRIVPIRTTFRACQLLISCTGPSRSSTRPIFGLTISSIEPIIDGMQKRVERT